MASSESQQHTLPDVPPSLSAGGHEMRGYYVHEDDSRPYHRQAPEDETPYIGLQARLSQIWINRWTILLLLVLVRVLFACADLDDNLGSARREALSACSNVESMGSAMASMPHYMSKGVNELTASGIEKSVNGLMSMVSLSITAVENIVLFIINLLTSTYVCLFTMAISGSLHVALNVVEDASKFLDKALGSIGDDFSSALDGLQDNINQFADAINGLPDIPGIDLPDVPKVDFSSEMDELNNLQLPSGLNEGLDTLNDSIPNFKQVHHFTNQAIRFPFEKLKDLVEKEMGTYHFNRDLFPVPPRKQLTFCSDDDGINDFFDGLVDTEHTAKKIFIAVIVTLAVLVCIPMGWWEYKRWRTQQERIQRLEERRLDGQKLQPMDVAYCITRPHTSHVGLKLANRFESSRHRVMVRWAIAYATSPAALFVLALGLAGLFSCLCQYALLRSVESEVPELSSQVSEFAEKVVWELNNASEAWAVSTNHEIHSANGDLNDKLFGWVNTSTTAVNDTLNTFVDEMEGAIHDVFGGTILEDPVKEVINCLILLKVRGIEKGLTWIHDHAHVTFPDLPQDVFSLGAVASIHNDSASDSFLADPSSSADDAITEVADRLIDFMAAGIRQEAIISACLVIVWVLIALIGFFRTVFLLATPTKRLAPDPATMNTTGADAGRPMSVAPPYSPSKYTLAPRPFQPRAEEDDDPEKITAVNSHNTGLSTMAPAHTRASSHGAIGGYNEKTAHGFPPDNKF